MAKTVAEVMSMVKDNEVKIVDFRFTDTRGKEQHVSVPLSHFDEDKFNEGHAFDAQLDVRAQLRVIDRRQAEDLDARALALNGFHDGRQRAFLAVEHDDRALAHGLAVLQGWVVVIQHPFHHRPGHDREARHAVHGSAPCPRAAETRNAVEGVGDQAGALREGAQVQAVQVVGALGLKSLTLAGCCFLHARDDQGLGLRRQHQRHAQRLRGGLARVVIGCGANAAAREHHVARGKGALQHSGNALAVVTRVFGPGQAHAALGQQRDALGQVLVLALAREDFVAHDDNAHARHARATGPDQRRVRLNAQFRAGGIGHGDLSGQSRWKSTGS